MNGADEHEKRSPRALPVTYDEPAAASANPEAEPPAVHAGHRPVDPDDADEVLTEAIPGSEEADAAVLAESRKRTRRAFLGAAAGAVAGLGMYALLERGPKSEMQPKPLRAAFNLDAKLSRAALRLHPLAPTYPLSRAETLRVNGIVGLKRMLVPESWRLQLVGARDAERHLRFTRDVTGWDYRYAGGTMDQAENHDTKAPPGPEDNQDEDQDRNHGEDDNRTGRKPRGQEEAGESASTLRPGTPGLLLTLADILALPRHELVTEFKCIEGWSQVVHWAGVRVADFLLRYPPALVHGREPRYVYMETPDGDYYTGYELAALRHPQALLVTEMMGKPLTAIHGAPLRLHMPTKYGYKQIKRIGSMVYGDTQPDDYWTKLGYDWYADL